MLTQGHLVEMLPAETVRVLCVDQEWAAIKQSSSENPALRTSAENLAYVIYTSGSTGRPKGLSVSHRNVVRLVKETNYCVFTPEEVFLQLAPISFDASTFELWGSLLNGARLVVMPAAAPTLEELEQVLKRHQVSTLWLTASLFHLMVDQQLSGLRSVRQLLAGGECSQCRTCGRRLRTWVATAV